MSVEQAYIEGFIKRASEYGYSRAESINIFKEANMQTMTPKQDPMVIPPTPGAPPHIPPYKPKYNPPVQPETISPEINEQLTGVSPSSMTPKNKWEQGLHDVMAKKPALAAKTFMGRPPTQLDIAHGHADDITKAIDRNTSEYRKNLGYIPYAERGIKGVYNSLVNRINPPAPDPNAAHISRIQEHFKQYDPNWGDKFRLPLPSNLEDNGGRGLNYYQQRKDDFIPSNVGHMNFWRTLQK
jgi:hypothetical protein